MASLQSDDGYPSPVSESQSQVEDFDAQVVPSTEDAVDVDVDDFIVDGSRFRSRDSDTPGSLVDFVVPDSYCSGGSGENKEISGKTSYSVERENETD